jgi:hypothetical protein
MRTFEVVERAVIPKITVAKDRVTLKVPSDMAISERELYIGLAKFVDAQVKSVDTTLRGNIRYNTLILSRRTYTDGQPVHKFIITGVGEYKQVF